MIQVTLKHVPCSPVCQLISAGSVGFAFFSSVIMLFLALLVLYKKRYFKLMHTTENPNSNAYECFGTTRDI